MNRPVLDYRRPPDRREGRSPAARRATLAGASLVLAVTSICLAGAGYVVTLSVMRSDMLTPLAILFLMVATWLVAVALGFAALVDRDGPRRRALVALAICAAEVVVFGVMCGL